MLTVVSMMTNPTANHSSSNGNLIRIKTKISLFSLDFTSSWLDNYHRSAPLTQTPKAHTQTTVLRKCNCETHFGFNFDGLFVDSRMIEFGFRHVGNPFGCELINVCTLATVAMITANNCKAKNDYRNKTHNTIETKSNNRHNQSNATNINKSRNSPQFTDSIRQNN